VARFSIDKRPFGHTVQLEAGWTLERADTKARCLARLDIPEVNGSNVQLATDSAVKNNIAPVPSNLELNLRYPNDSAQLQGFQK